MFNDIFQKYDLLNTILSFGFDSIWRKKTVSGMPDTGLIIDLCGGGGQLARSLYLKSGFSGDIIIADISVNMIKSSRTIIHSDFADRLLRVVCDVEYLPFKDGAFDGALSGFGLRNLSDLGRFSSEVRRTMKAGAKARILELSHPNNKIFGPLYRFYFYRVTPRIARLFTSKDYAYKYLPKSLKAFPRRNEIMSVLSSNWSGHYYDELFGGISVIYTLLK